MGYWFSPTQGYHEGSQDFADDVATPRRPDPTYVWNGTAWVESLTAAFWVQLALAALDDADTTVSRIMQAVMRGTTTLAAADVVAWATYMAALRVIAGGGPGPLPAKPAYPAGT